MFIFTEPLRTFIIFCSIREKMTLTCTGICASFGDFRSIIDNQTWLYKHFFQLYRSGKTFPFSMCTPIYGIASILSFDVSSHNVHIEKGIEIYLPLTQLYKLDIVLHSLSMINCATFFRFDVSFHNVHNSL